MNLNKKLMLTLKKRFTLALLWSITTLLFCYLVLGLGLIFIGDKAGSDFIVGNIYTLAPGFFAIIFIITFKTDILSFNQFKYPGFQWIFFGFAYTVTVLFFTILTSLLLGEMSFNAQYTPFKGELEGFSTSVQILDIILFFIIVGFLLLFSPGGFIRIIGEELGWRGYLLPELLKMKPKISFLITSLIVGLVWFLYHIPYFTILAPVENDKIIYLLLGSAGVFFGANWAMMWAYLKTKNLWPALSLHFIWNLMAPVLTGNVYSKSLGWLNPNLDNIWLVNGEGLIGGFYHFIIGLVFLYLILRDKDLLSQQYDKLVEINNNNINLEPKRIKIS